ncbi:MAG: hypothetical protein QOF81_3628 [Acidimicrobiaceae bacterium]|nr:hypothetical protein [Acidimicrobiaceae bacterium]
MVWPGGELVWLPKADKLWFEPTWRTQRTGWTIDRLWGAQGASRVSGPPTCGFPGMLGRQSDNSAIFEVARGAQLATFRLPRGRPRTPRTSPKVCPDQVLRGGGEENRTPEPHAMHPFCRPSRSLASVPVG